MAGLPQPGTTIARVRLHGGGDDPLAAQLRAAQVLAASGDFSDAVPASAILCVKRMADPRPGHIVLARRAAPDAWTRAVRDRISDLAQRAVRPAREAAADGDEAVIFTDRVELLACLARDWCAGALGRWWWRALVGDAVGLDAVLRLWLEVPMHVTAALHQAVAMPVAAPFVRHLSPAAVRTLLDAVIASHALVCLRALPERAGQMSGVTARPASASPSPSMPAAAPSAVSTDAPWRRWAPESMEPALRSDQQLLLGIALTVVRAPVHVRSAAFAEAAARWCDDSAVAAAPESRAPDQAWTTAEAPVGTSPPLPPAALAPVMGAPAVAPDVAAPASWLVRPEDSVAVEPSFAPPHAVGASASAVTAPPFAEGLSVTTQYGGVFYLLNVALALELYGDFTRPATRGLDLSIWDFVTLAAGSLLHGNRPTARALNPPDGDPVWAVLARLAGREPGQRPGEAFQAPDAWRVPPDWLRAFPERVGWRWAAAGGRLRVGHPAGFLVLDVPRTAAPAARQGATELAAYDTAARRAAQPIPGPRDSTPLARWVTWLTAYLRARLARALGSQRRTGIGRAIFCGPGRVTVTSTRVDIALSLAAQPIAIRLAGLDRDPGWIPAADRIVSFHFA